MSAATMITMIDYGASNLRSAQKAFEFAGAQVQVTEEPEIVAAAKKLVLPGVGAFGAGMDALRRRGLDVALQTAVGRGMPLLGICLGMQFLLDESDEMGQHSGLGLLPGRVRRFPANGLKVPHIGWNQIDHDGRHPLLQGIPGGAHAYFVHSYYCEPADPTTIVARTDYGEPFAAVIGQGHLFGIQFHPEKSQQVGLRIIENYLNL